MFKDLSLYNLKNIPVYAYITLNIIIEISFLKLHIVWKCVFTCAFKCSLYSHVIYLYNECLHLTGQEKVYSW